MLFVPKFHVKKKKNKVPTLILKLEKKRTYMRSKNNFEFFRSNLKRLSVSERVLLGGKSSRKLSYLCKGVGKILCKRIFMAHCLWLDFQFTIEIN